MVLARVTASKMFRFFRLYLVEKGNREKGTIGENRAEVYDPQYQ
jgi:hypothetical protein